MTDERRQDIELLFTGEDKNVDWYIGTGPAIEADGTASDAATSITVKRLKRSIASGAKVRFAPPGEAGLVVTLSAAAKYGATTLSVSAIDGTLYQGETGRQCQDVTGWTLEAEITLPPATTALLELGASIQTASEGHVRATFTDTHLGTTLSAKSHDYKLRKTNDPSAVLAYGSLVLREF